jgi:alkylation response protein AidB-like acyl-CoA dehydrogenase
VTTLEDREMLLDMIRKFARAELLDADRRCDENESSLCEMLPEMAEMGLMGLLMPEALGGLGCDMQTYSSIIREISYASPSMAVTLSVHSMTLKIVKSAASESWIDEHLESCGSADALMAFAISEADAGSDPAAVRAAATKVDDGYRLTGSKMWITNGLRGRWFLVLARTDPNSLRSNGLSALLVDGRDAGVSRDKICGKMGIRGSETVVLHLNDVFVPDEQLLGNEGEGFKVCMGALDEGRIGIAAQAIGIAEACLDEMTSYARQRAQFGRPIGRFQAIQNMIADSLVELEASRMLMNRAAWLIDAGKKNSKASAMAKLYASEAANRIADRAVQVHGGTGYVRECRVEQLYRDARITRIYESTSEIQRHVIAKELVKSGVEG